MKKSFVFHKILHKKCIRIILFEYRRLSERKPWISSHFKSVPVVTMTWQLIWNGPWENDRYKAELVDIYKLAKLRLTKPKLYILNKIHFLSYKISPKTELISAIISLSELVQFLSPASNNLKGKFILNIT